jgi:hypothetical protein
MPGWREGGGVCCTHARARTAHAFLAVEKRTHARSAVRALIKMLELPYKDVRDEAQQTLDHFGIDDDASRAIQEQVGTPDHAHPSASPPQAQEPRIDWDLPTFPRP